MKSVATSYIIIIIFDTVLVQLNLQLEDNIKRTIILIITSTLLGVLIGKITTHRWFNILLYKCRIGRTTNSNIWDDIIKPNTWVRVFMKDGSSYLGQYRYGEPFKSEPIIVLATYQKLDSENDIVLDYNEDLREMIMINTKDFDRIEIIYR